MSASPFRSLLVDLYEQQGGRDRLDHLLADEHARLALYRAAIANSETERWLPVLLADPDVTMTNAVLVEVIDRRGASMSAVEFERWAAGLLTGSRARPFVQSRVGEWLIYNRLGSDESAVSDLLKASDWLQRKVADESTSREVLVALADGGRTKRVRSSAGQRLQSERLE